MAIQFTLQPKPQGQQLRAGQIETVAPTPGDRLKPKILEELALIGAAEADAPGDATA
jgi:hypothetical protein